MSEIAVVAARKVRLQQRAEEGDERAKTALALAHDPNKFLSTVQFGITMVGVLAGAYGGATIATKLAVPIREAPAADEESARVASEVANGANLENLSEADRARLDRINELLDEQVRPYLQGDGGDLYILGLEENQLMVHYQGACGSCPSAISGTLAGIENLVRQIEPDIEVVAV